MKETIVFLPNSSDIDEKSIHFLWAVSFSQSPIRIFRISDVSIANDILKKIEYSSTVTNIPSVVYKDRSFRNVESLSKTITHDNNMILFSRMAAILKERELIYKPADDNDKVIRVTLNDSIIQDQGGIIHDNVRTKIEDDGSIKMFVWAIEEKRYIAVGREELVE